MTTCGTAFLFSEEVQDLLGGSHPVEMSAVHPLWDQAIRHWGPWCEGRVAVDDPDGGDLGITGWTAARSGTGNVFLCRDCSSAFDVAWKLNGWGLLAEWGAVIAATQWTGRGQVRRPWQSLPGNLHVVWRSPMVPGEWDGLTSLIPAWLTARVLGSLGWEVRLKWPNDLVWNGKKIGGILAEQRGETVMVGLGLNFVAAPASDMLRDGAALPAGSMGGRIDPATCWDRLVSECESWYKNNLPVLRPEHFAGAFSDVLLWKNRSVAIAEYGEGRAEVRGVVLGVAVDGGLLLSVDGKVRRITSGEIRPLA
ncbi:biotin--[acetyl-CoA-carboxylase] ligase [Desulfonatronum sp. SC1]|uniref:biotin--[acetyl-CoA-carboxylase] ligase n=1 Tax=Desulfonatronum sp. SC1 TaxID=2109626 RepID=UPI000D3012D6|nr:biotin--[acetyl-CoA-carboxylase] ligase [Desulfonatronum sp. SC1]PTN36856.1 biotin--[acetyl-CoA-carboxylase] ligase [Desulfonatronum sp. SC1]